ncbi:hypothetical protein BDF22DRAFT_741938 [Syncephalis plumigaleata]|nr:hypothetical protein BDF22DRAFT_741938 [Syncephalis plumigaleata]
MDDQLPVEANTSAVQADITSPEFINSLLGPPPSQTNTDDDISSSSNSESSALLNRLLFKNIVFVLTNIPSQSESNNIKSEDKLIQCTKEELTYLIQDYGGQVEPDISVSNVNAASDDVLNNHTTILICGEIKRTKKYFLALALDIPRISYRWIIDVTKSGRLDTILNYSLCNGFSKELNAFVASRPIPAITSIIHLKGSTTFKSDWETVLTAAGATIVDHKQLRTIGCDYLVLEKRPTSTWINNLSDTVRSRIKAIVTSEWVAQCLINQRVVRWQQHPSYTQWS